MFWTSCLSQDVTLRTTWGWLLTYVLYLLLELAIGIQKIVNHYSETFKCLEQTKERLLKIELGAEYLVWLVTRNRYILKGG